ncbi:pyruvate formate-lyase-activating protein [Feifania hominis]|uniref:Pyruvate formate-lyase-activating enzyme n=1 Tax=Feifania hominis TaxID=2763660 RepID=A0A926DDN4_9FIRM|nr:pyruvate formate-lyase-activating protein [Feifania hominis]MBC8536281.1 pyruvate formate lyase-activating protein [Feifania hominis]
MTGRVHSIQSLGTLDGPGVRAVVFLQGCPLRCAYCHNPDTWDFAGGSVMTAQELFERVRRWRPYFGESGGVTVSGGEALCQADFTRELFTLCHGESIHTALDTSGCLAGAQVEALLDVTDYVLLDYKMTTDADYRAYCGCGLDDVERFLTLLDARGIATRLRQVIVAGFNDTAENVRALGRVRERHPCVESIELLPFRKLCREKYESMGLPFRFDCYDETPEQIIKELQKLL